MTEAEKQERKPHRDVKSGTGRSIVVIGVCQAGLATGYYLQEFGLEFVLLADDETRQVWLVGPDRGQLPRRLLGLDIYRWIGPTLLKLSRTSFLGRRLYEKVSGQGDPVFENEYAKMQDAGVERVLGRITEVKDGRPATEEGRRFDVTNVLWCTGFTPEFSWIDVEIFQEDGVPRHRRGVVEEAPGLYFVGLPWLDRLNSSLIGGVGTDAKHIASHIKTQVQDGE